MERLRHNREYFERFRPVLRPNGCLHAIGLNILVLRTRRFQSSSPVTPARAMLKLAPRCLDRLLQRLADVSELS
jgi:hypothetical protein